MLDTLQVTKELRESGFAEPQAKAIASAFGIIAGNVAPRDDFQCNAAQVTLYKTFGELRREMHAGFEEMHRLVLRAALGAITVNIAMVTVIFAIVKYLI